MHVPATCVSLAAGVPDNVWLRSSDPAVESHRLRDFNLPCSNGGTQPDVVYAGRRWAFSRTYFERETDGSETRWLLFWDCGPPGHGGR